MRRSPPARRKPQFHAVACVCVSNGRVLLLERGREPHLGYWELPTGRAEQEEAPRRAMIRSVLEQAGIALSPQDLSFLAELYMDAGGPSFTYTVFYVHFPKQPAIHVSPDEYARCRWIELDRIAELRVTPGLKECVNLLEADLLRLISAQDSRSLASVEQAIERRLGFRPSMWRAVARPMAVVIGPPAVGKTTLLKQYVAGAPGVAYVRDIIPIQRGARQDNYLTRYVRGDRAYALPCQMETLLLRALQTLTASEGSILDQNIYSSLAYTKALRCRDDLTPEEFETFYQYYCLVESALPPPRTILHLTARTEVLMRRLRGRRRKLERGFTSGYVALVAQCFEEVAEGLADGPTVLRLDSSDLTPAEVLERFRALLRDSLPRTSSATR